MLFWDFRLDATHSCCPFAQNRPLILSPHLSPHPSYIPESQGLRKRKNEPALQICPPLLPELGTRDVPY